MKTTIYRILQCTMLAMLCVSCDEVLDESPDNRTFIDTPEKIAELLVGAYPEAGYVPFLEPMSDNAEDKGPSGTTDFRINEAMYFWEDINDDDAETPTNYWEEAYAAIAQANQALASVEELGGGPELNPLRGEALVCRAYAHYMLVNIFSKAYNPATANIDLGVPYVEAPETVLLQEFERGTVAQVYANIRRDLEEGLPLIEDNYDVPAFHFTKSAANAFASRFYLTLGEWDRVIAHSNAALGTSNTPTNLRDIVEIVVENNLTLEQQFIRYTSSTQEPANLLLVSGNSRYDRIDGLARYQLTDRLLDQLFRFNLLLEKRWAYNTFTIGGSGNNGVPKYTEFFRVTNFAANTGFAFVSFVLLSTDEVLLNRAEAYAMLGQFDQATNDINASLEVKIRDYLSEEDLQSPEDISAFYSNTPEDLFTPFYEIPQEALPFIAAVLDIKRTIFYNEGLRWFDIKRHDIRVEHITQDGNIFVLPKGDNRRAVQIPESAQAFGVQENPR